LPRRLSVSDRQEFCVYDDRIYVLILSNLRILGVASIAASLSHAPDLAQLLIAAAVAALVYELRSRTPWR
jgi:hypothetical protein